jgi:hypothetical protein
MIIDSDDEQAGSHGPAVEDKFEFEDEEDEIDPSQPYPSIIQHFNLDFGVAVMHIAVPQFSTTVESAISELGPAMLKDKIVFAAVCSDQKIRLITRSLYPPSPASKLHHAAGSGASDETLLELEAGSFPLDAVSVTFNKLEGSQWQILVASHSRTGPGLLLIHRVPITGKKQQGKIGFALSGDYATSPQKIPLSSPATRISFNPNLLSPYQSKQLLVVDRTGACRIYGYGPSYIPTSASAEGGSDLSTPTGSWLLTMYPGFNNNKLDTSVASPSFPHGNTGRKTVVDCQWTMGGKAVIVLLGDGEWGIWDIEGCGPGSGGKGILGRQSIKGGAMTAFTLSGWLDGAPVKSTSGRGSLGQASNSKFAPMTPSTRKTAEPVLFSGRAGQGHTDGQISVTPLPTASTTSIAEECVAFWFQESYYVIPNLRAYWESQARRTNGGSGNLFVTSSPASRMIRIDGVNLRGERCTGIALIPRESASKPSLPVELLITAEHRYVIVSDDTPTLRGPRQRAISQTRYQALPSTELDVTEIDEALSRMDNGNSLMPTRKQIDFLR